MIYQVPDKIIDYIYKNDQDLAKYVKFKGPIKYTLHDSIYESIVRTVVSQQISMRALNSILSKVDPKIITTPSLTLEHIDDFRVAPSKKQTVYDIATDFVNGKLSEELLKSVSNEELSDILCQYKGVGPWTVSMVEIFGRHNPNILIDNDFGIIKGIKKVYNIEKINKSVITTVHNRVNPYNSFACFYFWEAAADKLYNVL